MADGGDKGDSVQVELPVDVLCRLLRERNLVASEFRCLNDSSARAGWSALKASLLTQGRHKAH